MRIPSRQRNITVTFPNVVLFFNNVANGNHCKIYLQHGRNITEILQKDVHQFDRDKL